MKRAEAQARSLLSAGATIALIGIALCITDNENIGAYVTLGGLALFVVALHRFGRTGPDESRLAS